MERLLHHRVLASFLVEHTQSHEHVSVREAVELGWSEIQRCLFNELGDMSYASQFPGSYDDFFSVHFLPRRVQEATEAWAKRITHRKGDMRYLCYCDVDPIFEPDGLYMDSSGSLGFSLGDEWVEIYSHPDVVLVRDAIISGSRFRLIGNISLRMGTMLSDVQHSLRSLVQSVEAKDNKNLVASTSNALVVFQGWWESRNCIDTSLRPLGNMVQVFSKSIDPLSEISNLLGEYGENVFRFD